MLWTTEQGCALRRRKKNQAIGCDAQTGWHIHGFFFFFLILFQVISYLVLIYDLILTNYKVLYPLKIFFLILQVKHGIE